MSELPAVPQLAASRSWADAKVEWYFTALTSDVPKSPVKQVTDSELPVICEPPAGVERTEPSPRMTVWVGSIPLVEPVGCRTRTSGEFASVTCTSYGLSLVEEWRPATHV